MTASTKSINLIFKIKVAEIALVLLFFTIIGTACTRKKEAYRMTYEGIPFLENTVAKAQSIPGKVQCEFFDTGGEGIAYHDSDNKNSGSGGLNKGEGYLNNFRINEAVDISYTKFHDQIDNSAYNFIQPDENQLYMGWTEPGEWVRYSIDVSETGNYQIGTRYTSNRGGSIQLFIDDTDSTGLLNIPTTFVADDSLSWRQWHHWNEIDSLCIQHIYKGRRIITLKIEEEGNFNFDYLLFAKID